MAAFVLDGEPPPPELTRAMNYRRWGVQDIMSLPAGYLPKMNVGLTYYDALSAWKRAKTGSLVAWTEKNPQANEVVSWVLAQRMNNWGEDGNSDE